MANTLQAQPTDEPRLARYNAQRIGFTSGALAAAVMLVAIVLLRVLSGVLSKNAGVTPEQAKKEWVAGLIPGVVLVPSGVLAVNRAQERGCTYCSGG